MAIKDYSKNPRNDGYRGIRVYHSVNGKLIQKYFHQKNMTEAIAYNEALIKAHQHRGATIAKRHSQHYHYQAERYDPPRRTQVVGINRTFEYQRQCHDNIWYPGFVMTHHNKVKKLKCNSSRKITRSRDLQATWREACQVLSRWRGYKRVPKGWYDKCPTVEDFNTLRLWYCANGKSIAVHNMDVFDHTHN